MGARTEEYIQPDSGGTYVMEGWRGGRFYARYADPAVIRSLWEAQTILPAEYAIATAKHEGAINQVDTEPSGFVSWGAYQVSDSERQKVGEPSANLVDLIDATRVFARLSETNLQNLLAVLQLTYPTSPQEMLALPVDVWPYLAMVHNQGLGQTTANIKNYGFDWETYKAAVPGIEIVRHGYGDDVRNAVATGKLRPNLVLNSVYPWTVLAAGVVFLAGSAYALARTLRR